MAAVFAAVALVPLAGGARSDAQTLYVTFLVTGGFRVTLPDGTPIGTPSPPGTTIPPGTYELVFDNTSNVSSYIRCVTCVSMCTTQRPFE